MSGFGLSPGRVTMNRAAVWKVLALGLLPCCCSAGCGTFNSSAAPQNGVPDPLLEEIVKQGVPGKKSWPVPLQADAVLREVPVLTPVAQARAVMERHGFSCWPCVPDSGGTCLHCTAYRRKSPLAADKVVVKLFYEADRVVYEEVTVEYDVPHPDRGFWPVF
jgi:hypothetical protein